MSGSRINRTRLRRVVAWCLKIAALVVCVMYAPSIVMYYAFYRASSVEVSYIVGNQPGHRYETVKLSGNEMAAFCTQMKNDTSPIYIQVHAVLSNMKVRAFDRQGTEIASFGVYASGEKSESLGTLFDLAQAGTRVEMRRPSESPWIIHLMREAR
jgi:hypothetical protein